MTVEELAIILRAGYRGPIVEGDEWRGLAAHIIELLKMQRRDCADAVKAYHVVFPSIIRDDVAETVRNTPLVIDEPVIKP